jgi:hypothetical protein
MRIEWRSRDVDHDALVAVDDSSGTVLASWTLDTVLLADFLNDMTDLEAHASKTRVDVDGGDPESWRTLVLGRSDDGGIAGINPGLYWDRVTIWFRAKGDDPHNYRKNQQKHLL